MKTVRNVLEVGFKDKVLRETDNIEELRQAYEDLLKAYQKEICKNVMLERKLEESNITMIV